MFTRKKKELMLVASGLLFLFGFSIFGSLMITPNAIAATATKKVVKKKAPVKKFTAAQIAKASIDLVNAAKGGNSFGVQNALKKGAKPNSFDKELNRSALAWAAASGNAGCVRLLINAKASLNLPDKHANTALILASTKGYAEIVQALVIAKADVNLVDKNIKTALLYAAEGGYFPVVKFLVDAKANVNAVDKDGKTALMFSCMKSSGQEYLDMANYLIAAGADVNIKDKNNETALMFAVKSRRVDIIKALIAAKADVNVRNNSQQTAYNMALMTGDSELINTIKNAGGIV